MAYFSRTLNRVEGNYCVTRRELLPVVLVVRHFKPYLHGKRLLVLTDHASPAWSQVARWLEALQEYD